VESVVLTLGNVTRESSINDSEAHVKLFEGIPVPVICTAAGGYPPPQVTIRIDNSDITHIFETAVNQTLLPGDGHGLRYVEYETHLWTPRYVPQADADQRILYCSAEVAGLQVVVRRMQLNICCKSLICLSVHITIHIDAFYLEISHYETLNSLITFTCYNNLWNVSRDT